MTCPHCSKQDVTLTNGRIVTHRPMANGAHDAVMVDGGLMSQDEWNEYCAGVVARAQPAAPVCLICGRAYDSPYRSYDPEGRVVHGCVARVHDGHLVTPSESARWQAKGKRDFGAQRVYGRPMTPREQRAMWKAMR